MIQKHKTMRTRILTLLVGCFALLSSCEKDGDFLQVLGLSSSELKASEESVVLTKATASNSVLALAWNSSKLSVSDTSKGVPNNVPKVWVEVSKSASFDSLTSLTPTSNSYTFLGAVLNTVGKDLGLKAGISTPLYFRVRSALGVNTSPYYSNVTKVNVTCYTIDMSIGYILSEKKETTGFNLYSPKSDGEYAGFTADNAWAHWFLLEGDGTIWGNTPADKTEFQITKDATAWNFWYPGKGGCYYTTISTTKKEWTATYIPELAISGDATATMSFDKATVKWTASFTTTKANATIKVNCSKASLYNQTSKTDDAAAIAKSIGFTANSDSTLSFDWNSASAGNITFAKEGDYTLTFDLSNPTKLVYHVSSGLAIPEPVVSEMLYLPGIDDVVSGSWTFNNYLKLISKDDQTYAGAAYISSKWGYEMSPTSGDWENYYKMGATEGSLLFKSSTSITAPTAGLYLIQADLKKLTYSHTAITSLSYAGLNDNWAMTPMNTTTVNGVYSSSVTITKTAPYGCKLYMNNSWDYFYGGSNGVLGYKTDGFTDDAIIGAGTYDLIADIRNATSYVYLGSQIYIGGLNDKWDFTSTVLNKSAIGVYTGSVTITKASSYGMKIYITSGNWDRYFGGSFNSLSYLGSSITDDQSLAVGTYNITVDILNKKCSFVAAKKK